MVRGDSERVVIVGEVMKIKRRYQRIYDEDVKKVLVWLWELLDYSCSKRLQATLNWLIPKIEEQRKLNQLYSLARLAYNFFQVRMKLQSKEKVGSQKSKKHDYPRTSCQQLLESQDIKERVEGPVQEDV